MEELNSRFEEFIRALRPTDPQYDLAKNELDFIEAKMSGFTQATDPYIFKKALRSGSYAKGEILRRHESGDFDADIGLYFVVRDSSKSPQDLLDHVETLLRRAYENRTERQPVFDRGTKSCVRVKFEINPKINIDAVPIISLDHPTIENYGYIPRRDREKRKTSVTEHVKFVSDRNAKHEDTPFNQLVMLWKWWRNHALDDSLKDKTSSFFINLVIGKAFDETKQSYNENWLENLLRMGTWIIRHRLAEPVYFPDSRVRQSSSPLKDPVVVLDPINAENNIAQDWKHDDRDKFVQEVQSFCDVLSDAINDARAGDTDAALETLDGVFQNFSIWSEES